MTLVGNALDWDAETDLLVVPAGRLTMKEHKINADLISLHQARRIAVAEGNVEATLQQPSGPVELTTESMEVILERQGEETVARHLDARGVKKIQREGAEIFCSRFRFDVRENSGTIFGGPVAHLRKENTQIWAPLVAIKGEEFVIGGPKFIKFKDGDKDASATSGGDIVMKGSTIRLQDRAWISTPDFRLHAGGIDVEIGEDKKLKALNAHGGVRLHAVEQGQAVTATGSHAFQKAGSSTIELFGGPLATLTSESRRLWANILTFDQTHHKFTASGTERAVRMIFEEQQNGAKNNSHPR